MDYMIMEYDLRTGECATVGRSCGDDSGEAKDRFVEKNNWQRRQGIWLIARGPIR